MNAMAEQREKRKQNPEKNERRIKPEGVLWWWDITEMSLMADSVLFWSLKCLIGEGGISNLSVTVSADAGSLTAEHSDRLWREAHEPISLHFKAMEEERNKTEIERKREKNEEERNEIRERHGNGSWVVERTEFIFKF